MKQFLVYVVEVPEQKAIKEPEPKQIDITLVTEPSALIPEQEPNLQSSLDSVI